jgi:hypothetical protein
MYSKITTFARLCGANFITCTTIKTKLDYGNRNGIYQGIEKKG